MYLISSVQNLINLQWEECYSSQYILTSHLENIIDTMPYRVRGSATFYDTASEAVLQYADEWLDIPGLGETHQAEGEDCVVHRIVLLQLDGTVESVVYTPDGLLFDDSDVGSIPWPNPGNEDIPAGFLDVNTWPHPRREFEYFRPGIAMMRGHLHIVASKDGPFLL